MEKTNIELYDEVINMFEEAIAVEREKRLKKAKVSSNK